MIGNKFFYRFFSSKNIDYCGSIQKIIHYNLTGILLFFLVKTLSHRESLSNFVSFHIPDKANNFSFLISADALIVANGLPSLVRMILSILGKISAQSPNLRIKSVTGIILVSIIHKLTFYAYHVKYQNTYNNMYKVLRGGTGRGKDRNQIQVGEREMI